MRIATIQQYAVFTEYLTLLSFESFHICLVREMFTPRQLACVAGSLGLGVVLILWFGGGDEKWEEKKNWGEGAREGEPAVMPRYFSCFAAVRGRRILLAYWCNICKFISPEVF